jgi:erythromycin esterase
MSSMGDAEVCSWLRTRAQKLDALEAGHGFADLTTLLETWKGLDVVGLGESTHGTRELFTLKHRLLEFLVRELGLQVFAMEASESASVAVDDYVRYGVGDGGEALADLRFWTWNTEEMASIIGWLRRHNAGLPADRRVRFVGVDPQRLEAAVDAVEDYLKQVAPAEVERFSSALRALRDPRTPTDPPLPRSVLARCVELRDLLDSAGGTGDGDDRVSRHAGHLVRSAELATAASSRSGPDSYYGVRDRLMAEGVADAVRGVAGSDGLPVAVWAHNAHISRGRSTAEVAPMGPTSATCSVAATTPSVSPWGPDGSTRAGSGSSGV